MSRLALRFGAPLALAALTALALTGCTGQAQPGSTATTGAGAGGAITITASDTACDLSATTAQAGTLTFRFTNTGSKVNEFYLYAAGDRIVTEAENITPGLSREIKVEVTEAGTYTVACKPGMSGDGIRTQLTVTGTAPKGSSDAKLTTAVAAYTKYVESETDELVEETGEFVAAVKQGDVAKAKALYPKARMPWEEIEPVADAFGDLDHRIDGREAVLATGAKFTGFHRLERDLWKTGLQPDSGAVADQLLADVKQIAAKAETVEPEALSIAGGVDALLDEVATTKVTGEEERYSHTDLWDVKGNVVGSQQALAALRPVIGERAPELLKALDARFVALTTLLDSHRAGDGYRLYTQLTPADVGALTVALDALSQEVAKVPGVVGAP